MLCLTGRPSLCPPTRPCLLRAAWGTGPVGGAQTQAHPGRAGARGDLALPQASHTLQWNGQLEDPRSL